MAGKVSINKKPLIIIIAGIIGLISLLFIFEAYEISLKDLTKCPDIPDTKMVVFTEQENNNNNDNNNMGTNKNMDNKPVIEPPQPLKYIDNNVKYGDIEPYTNPLQYDQCKYAIIKKEFLNEAELLKAYNNIYAPDNPLKLYWMTREGINAIQLGIKNFKTQSIRGLDTLINIINNKNINELNDNELNEYNKYKHHPTYFMIPKCGSSSVINLLSQYNKDRNHKIISQHIKHDHIYIDCGFTFIRDPIARIISGYYTSNAHLWKHLNGFNNTNSVKSFKKINPFLNFIDINGEPRRFRQFIDDLITNPYRMTRWDDHFMSQTEHLSINYYTNITFFGKVESFDNDWKILSKKCKFFDGLKENMTKQMSGFGWSNPKSWDSGKYNNWVEYMSLKNYHNYSINTRKEGKNMEKVIPPAWYAINIEYYNKIVNYYWQDFKCFGYKPNWDSFKQKRDSYFNVHHF